MSSMYFVFLFFFVSLVSSPARPVTDKITHLPDQPPAQFNTTHHRNLFYYFVEAEVDPPSKPVVLWLHGGPGCSAVGEAAFSQHGPFLVTSKGLTQNPNSWNTEANMLYLDSPAGVGFSYSENVSDYLFLNDDFAARDHLVFLQLWFSKFSDFRTNDFFYSWRELCRTLCSPTCTPHPAEQI